MGQFHYFLMSPNTSWQVFNPSAIRKKNTSEMSILYLSVYIYLSVCLCLSVSLFNKNLIRNATEALMLHLIFCYHILFDDISAAEFGF